VQTGGSAIVLLEMVLEASEKKGCAEHEKRVGHNGAGNRTFHQRILPRAKRRRCNDQLGQVSKRSIEQPARSIARLFRNSFGGVTKQTCKRHDREH
jgi:hypothetical protein